MKITGKIGFVLIGLSIFISGAAVSADNDAERSALNASGSWLELVDKGLFAESWDEAAQLFRNAVTREGWNRQLRAVRSPLGKVMSRKVMSKSYRESLPGAPDGKYVVVQYRTSFEHKKSAVETVTPMLDKDGKWRVSGYYIR